MRKIAIAVITLFIAFSASAQNFNKEFDNLILLSKNKESLVYVDFLDKLEFTQDIGLGEPAINYTTLKSSQKIDKNGNVLLKKHPYISSYTYQVSDGIVKSIRLNIIPDKVSFVKELLISLYENPDNATYGHLGQVLFFVPNKYFITLKSESGMMSSSERYVNISALDFTKNYSKYDEFSKVGMVYFDNTPIKRLSDATMNALYFAYSFNKGTGFKGYVIKNDFSSDDWMFIEKMDFLFDNDEVITLEVDPNREVEKLFTVSCKERSINFVSSEFADKTLNAKSVKVKISGKSSYFTFELTPLHKYQILTAKYYYENDITPTPN